MGEPRQSREHITLSYDPREGTPYMIGFVRNLEGILQRIELRIEALQDRLDTLEGRLEALEAYNIAHP